MDWIQVRQLFEAVSDLPPEERDAFLSQQCGADNAIRSEVKKLVMAASKSPGFLETPVAGISDIPLQQFQETPLNPGQILNNRYEIREQIGGGGFSRVYLANDRQLPGRKTVVKVLRTGFQEKWMRHRFEQEIRALIQIDDPAVVSLLDHGETPAGLPYMVMQYVPGKTLAALMAEHSGAWPLERTVRLASQIGRGLTAVHNAQVCHRDLRPENIVVRNPGEPSEHAVIIDFGIAVLGERIKAVPTQVAGSPEYMAPEQLLGRPELTSDIYALGSIVFEMLTGRKLHACDAVRTPERAVEIYLANAPEFIRIAVSRAIHADHSQRYQHALEFSDALLAGQHVSRSHETSAADSTNFTSLFGVGTTRDSQMKPAAGNAADPLAGADAVQSGREKATDSFTAIFQTTPSGSPASGAQTEQTADNFTQVFGVKTGKEPCVSSPAERKSEHTPASPIPVANQKDSSIQWLSETPLNVSGRDKVNPSQGNGHSLDSDSRLFDEHTPPGYKSGSTNVSRRPGPAPSSAAAGRGDYTAIVQSPRGMEPTAVSPGPVPAPVAPANQKLIPAVVILTLIALLAILIGVLVSRWDNQSRSGRTSTSSSTASGRSSAGT